LLVAGCWLFNDLLIDDLNRFLFFIPDIFMTIRYPLVGAGFFMFLK
jgi:hypothetical protein